MTFWLIQWFLSALALILTSRVIRGFQISGIFSALIASIVIGFANIYIWPVLIFLTLPINILTLGLFTLVVNGIVLRICAAFLPGFAIETWFAAIFGSVFLSMVNLLFQFFLRGFGTAPQTY